MKWTSIMQLVLLCTAALLAPACTGEESTIYACQYEERTTDGCDGYGFGPWESVCYQFDSEDYYITPQEVCGNVTEPGLHCQAGCCVDFQYQNVNLSQGTCP